VNVLIMLAVIRQRLADVLNAPTPDVRTAQIVRLMTDIEGWEEGLRKRAHARQLKKLEAKAKVRT